MSRHFIHDARVQRLVHELVVPLVLRHGSVNAACEWLKRRLADLGEEASLYPNRLHTLLSADQNKAINESTVRVLERVLDASSGSDLDADNEVLAKLEARVRELWPQVRDDTDPARAIAERASLPLTVATALIDRSGLRERTQSTSAVVAPAQPMRLRAPDWSFQDTAVSRCIGALNDSVSAKVGLVLPTGAGKTRIALRIALEWLGGHAGNAVWVTHRSNLRDQAHQELQKLLALESNRVPEGAAKTLADRVEIIMLGALEARLAPGQTPPALVIVDEAHHAAAPSYEPLFSTKYPLRALLATATPNRTDGLPIGIDKIAYSVTYRELAERGVILIPQFEHFDVDDFDWSDAAIKDLADKIVTRASDDFHKIMVLAPRIERVTDFYQALIDRLGEDDDHPLSEDDIGYIHGGGNSAGVSNAEFLGTFKQKPRAIYVSAELLLEGFDDPMINTVIVTYATSSMVKLMQAAGRCLRYSPGKKQAFVVRARNDALAYHFDQRWMYQELSDYLRPRLEDFSYGNATELERLVRDILAANHVPEEQAARVLEELSSVAPGQTCKLLLHGLPYFGEREVFWSESSWEARLETSANSESLRRIFNDFCARGANIADPMPLLHEYGARFGFQSSFTPASDWRMYADLLTAMYRAYQEVYGNGARTADGLHRPFAPHGATTWIRYVTFHYVPALNPVLEQFLTDCYNAVDIAAKYLTNVSLWNIAIKIPVPLGPCEAHLLDEADATALSAALTHIRNVLRELPPARRCAALAAELAELDVSASLPLRVVQRLEYFLTDAGMNQFSCALTTRPDTSS
ncbi:MAG: DEAD/DEAH box helicase family protein [Deltaproteobacteria bacterium]|nr:DEAD/DEAH box helicase family protein [Kofleriaceae bacterium]